MIVALLILAAIGLGDSMPLPSGTYVKSGECQVKLSHHHLQQIIVY